MVTGNKTQEYAQPLKYVIPVHSMSENIIIIIIRVSAVFEEENAVLFIFT